MRQGTRHSCTVVWLYLTYTCLGVAIMIGVLSLFSAVTASLVAPAHCVMWGSVCMLITPITRLDQPKS